MIPTMIMVAPNGARKTRDDHPRVPLTIGETAAEAARCHAAGASILHAHVRDARHQHVLDSGLYRELIDEVAVQAPGMLVQITSEAVGIYSPQAQVDCIKAVKPQLTSMSLKEITAGFTDIKIAEAFYRWCQDEAVHVQHILYSADELEKFILYSQQGVIPGDNHCLLLVLGRYSHDQQSSPTDLAPFLGHDLDAFHWFVCAFGQQEQNCMLDAIDRGGHARVGFENNMYLPDGRLADHTAELVGSLVGTLSAEGKSIASDTDARHILGIAS